MDQSANGNATGDGLMDRRRSRRDAIVFRVGAVVVVALAAWFWPRGPGPHVAPSFNCAAATLPTEKTICTDPQLAQIDKDYDAYYQENLEVVSIAGDTEKLAIVIKGQQDFLAARNRCATNRYCIMGSYGVRNRELTQLVGVPGHGMYPQP
jgi:uncharacterized protein